MNPATALALILDLYQQIGELTEEIKRLREQVAKADTPTATPRSRTAQ